jgi:hypothetical protein
MFESGENVKPVKMDTKVCLFFLGENTEDLPAGSAPIDAAVGEGLCEDDVDDLFAEQQFSALGISDNIRNGCGSCCPGLHLGALEVIDHGENLALTKGGKFRIRWWLDGFGDGVRTVGTGLVLA